MNERIFVVVDVGRLAEIRSDRNFGEKLERAIRESSLPENNKHVVSDRGEVLATVVGSQFEMGVTRIAVCENGVSWFACGTWPPKWSMLDPLIATKLLFGEANK